MDLPRIAALLAPFLSDVTRAPSALSTAQLEQLSAYLDLLLRWNACINLTAVRDPEQIVPRHFGESLFAARQLYPPGQKLEAGNWKLLDLGSGAGFPGLPIKIWVPALHVTLIESQYRKAIFLREVIRALALPGVDVFPARAEDFKFSGETTLAPHLGNQDQCSPAAPGRVALGQNSTRDVAPSPATAITLTLRAVERFDRALATAARLLAGAPAVTRRLALLIGAAQVPRARQLVPGLTWSDPTPIPQSSNRIVLIGTRAPAGS